MSYPESVVTPLKPDQSPRFRIPKEIFLFFEFLILVNMACQALGLGPIAKATEATDPRPTSATPFDPSESEAADGACTIWTLLEASERGQPAWFLDKGLEDIEPSKQESETVDLPDNHIPANVDTVRLSVDLGGSTLNLNGTDDAHVWITAPGDVDWYTARFVDSATNGQNGVTNMDIPLANFKGLGSIAGQGLEPGDAIGGTFGTRVWDTDPYDIRFFGAFLYLAGDPDCVAGLAPTDAVITP